MGKKINYSKLAIVIFLTVLIWFWADRSLEEEYSIQTATIGIGRTRPELWVSFPNSAAIDINEIRLSGPSSMMNEFKTTINNDPEKLKFILYPEQFNIEKAGDYPIDVRDIIESSWIKKTGLLVKECDPFQIQVSAVDLVKRDVEVQCYDKNGLPISLETPQTVSMFVPADSRLTASVNLSDDERIRAIQQPIRKKPFITLPNKEKKEADSFVEIKLPPQENILERSTITNATLGYTLSENLSKGQYDIQIENDSLREILTIEIRATPEAKAAYDLQSYQVMLEILDKDVETSKTEFVRRKVYYKFPEDFVRSNQIILVGEKVEARFKVTQREQPVTPID